MGVTAGPRGHRLVDALSHAGASVSSAPTFETVAATPARLRVETDALLDREPAWLAVSTEDGLRCWLEAAGPLRGSVIHLLGEVDVAARSAAVARAVSSVGGRTSVAAVSGRGAELARLIADRGPRGATVGVQADGGGSPALVGPLSAAGHDVVSVRPHRWRPPTDPGPARRLVGQLVSGDIEVVTFTAPPAVAGLFEAAADLGHQSALVSALAGRTAVAAIGPVTAEAVEAHGARVTICPAQPTVDALVAAVALWRVMPGAHAPVTLDPSVRTVRRGAHRVSLSEREFALLASLSRRSGVVCPTPVLLREVWGHGDRRRLEVLVSRLRSRLATLDLSITVVPKRGYRLETLSAVASQSEPDL